MHLDAPIGLADLGQVFALGDLAHALGDAGARALHAERFVVADREYIEEAEQILADPVRPDMRIELLDHGAEVALLAEMFQRAHRGALLAHSSRSLRSTRSSVASTACISAICSFDCVSVILPSEIRRA